METHLPITEIKNKENPNNSASIGFIISYPFQYYIYKNIYNKIENKSEFIVDMTIFYPVKQPDGLLDEIIQLLQTEKAFYRVLYFESALFENHMKRFFKSYKILAGVWERGAIIHKVTRDIKKVTVTYGAGKETTFLRPSQALYDLTLDYGERSARLHSYFSNPVIIGNAKFDDWFSDSINSREISDITSRIDPSKKTILYLPTHGELSSIEAIEKQLKEVSGQYNILIKLHYFLKREEPWKVQLLEHGNLHVYQDSADILPLLKVSDMVLSDNSSAIFDAILVDKPTLVADFWTSEFLDKSHRKRRMLRRGFVGPVTYSESIEQQIKKNGTVVTVKNPSELKTKIEETLKDSTHLKERRLGLRRELFSYNDGKCGQRGADALLGLLMNESPSTRPILHHAMEIYKGTLSILSMGGERELLNKIDFYKNALLDRARIENEYFFSIIFTVKPDSLEVKNSFRALIEQNYPIKKFEIIIIGDFNWLEEVQEESNINSLKIKTIKCTGYDFYGDKIESAIKLADGSILVFTDSDHLVPSDWLLSFFATYKKEPEIVGCGGYVTDIRNNNIFNYYYLYKLAEKIGIEKEGYFHTKFFQIKNNLFNQNPMGEIANVSYRKKIIADVKLPATSLDEVGLVLKYKALEHGPVCFFPGSIKRTIDINLTRFLERNILYGGLIYSYRDKFYLKRDCPTFFKIVSEPVAYFSLSPSWERAKISFIILSANFGKWVGKLQFIIQEKLSYLKIVIDHNLRE